MIRIGQQAFLCGNRMLINHNSCELMKIVLKHNDQVKLYADQLTLQGVLTFIHTEFHLDRHSLSLTFQDPDGDDITILNDQDFNIMQAILDGREYVRINVEGVQLQPRPCTDKLITVSQRKEEESEQLAEQQATEQVQEDRVQVAQQEQEVQQVEEAEEGLSYYSMVKQQDLRERREKGRIGEHKMEEQQMEEQQMEELKVAQPQRILQKEPHLADKCRWSGKPQKTCQMKQFINQMVASLVDQRLKALLPCLKEQIMAHNKREELSQQKIMHQGFECKGCAATPIAGVRYECPKCPDFSLCQVCQAKIQHHHNLLKVKKIEAKEKPCEMPCLRQCFGGSFSGCHNGQRFQKSRQECGRWSGPHHIMKKLKGMSFIFGNEPESYRGFVQDNKQLWPRKTYEKYAQMTGMPETQFRHKFIALRCHKLSETFGNSVQSYKSFVQENYHLNQRELIDLIYDKGIEKRKEPCSWKGRSYNFTSFKREAKEQSRQQCQKEEPVEKEGGPVEKEGGPVEKEGGPVENEEWYLPEQEAKTAIAKSQEASSCNAVDSADTNKAKGLLFVSIKSMFPAAENKAIYRFVDQHYQSQSFDEVVGLWIENNSGK